MLWATRNKLLDCSVKAVELVLFLSASLSVVAAGRSSVHICVDRSTTGNAVIDIGIDVLGAS